MISVQQLSLSIDKKEILQSMGCRFNGGRFYAITGPNGSGKSTLLRCINRLETGYLGKITVNGSETRQLPSTQRANLMAYVPQQNKSDFAFTVNEFVEMGRYPHNTIQHNRLNIPVLSNEKALKVTDTLHLAHRTVNTLSGGELQRVVIARTLVQHTPIVLLDEPFSQLDIKHQQRMLRLFRQLCHQQQRTVVCVLHDFNQILGFADEVLILNLGRLVAQGPPLETLTPERLKSVFDVDMSWAYTPLGNMPGLLMMDSVIEKKKLPASSY
jgi:iron complex transport system ATP-binding protein